MTIGGRREENFRLELIVCSSGVIQRLRLCCDVTRWASFRSQAAVAGSLDWDRWLNASTWRSPSPERVTTASLASGRLWHKSLTWIAQRNCNQKLDVKFFISEEDGLIDSPMNEDSAASFYRVADVSNGIREVFCNVFPRDVHHIDHLVLDFLCTIAGYTYGDFLQAQTYRWKTRIETCQHLQDMGHSLLQGCGGTLKRRNSSVVTRKSTWMKEEDLCLHDS